MKRDDEIPTSFAAGII